jgi:hypothetical protein
MGWAKSCALRTYIHIYLSTAIHIHPIPLLVLSIDSYCTYSDVPCTSRRRFDSCVAKSYHLPNPTSLYPRLASFYLILYLGRYHLPNSRPWLVSSWYLVGIIYLILYHYSCHLPNLIIPSILLHLKSYVSMSIPSHLWVIHSVFMGIAWKSLYYSNQFPVRKKNEMKCITYMYPIPDLNVTVHAFT